MRVGFFSNIYRPVISGVVNAIDIIRKELLAQGHRPFIFAPGVAGYRDTHAGVWRFPSVQLLRTVNYPLAFPGWPPTHCAISRCNLDIVHTHHPFWLGEVAWAWSRWLKVPLVYTFHTQYEQYCHYISLPQPPLRKLTRWAVKNFARRCDLIIAPSPDIRELMQSYGITTWTETLPNAIDLSRFQNLRPRAQLRKQLGWPVEGTVALYAGRLGKEKNLRFLIEAIARVPELYLAIVGDGPELPHLRLLVSKLALEQRVFFSGAVTYALMPDYFQAADFFCIASTTEVKPLVVLEALASKLAVVAVSACGTADTLTDNHDGFLIPENLESFAAACARLAEDGELRQRMSRAAAQTAQQYSITNYTGRLVELYLEAQARKR